MLWWEKTSHWGNLPCQNLNVFQVRVTARITSVIPRVQPSIHRSQLSTVWILHSTSGNKRAWVIQIRVSDQETLFKLDTGAGVTAVCEETYGLLGKPTLNSPDKVLHGPSRYPLCVLGQFNCDLSYKGYKGKRTTTRIRRGGTDEQRFGTSCHHCT